MGLCSTTTEKLKGMEPCRSHCPQGSLAGLTPPLSSPKPILFLLKLDASQMFLFCPYVRAISMSLVPRRDGDRKPWLTNKRRRRGLQAWHSTTVRLPSLYFLKGKSPPLTHCLATAQSLWRSKVRPGKRKHLCLAEDTQMKRLWTLLCKMNRKYRTIQIFGSATN